MAYITGLANNIGELWTAMTAGLVANGWTLVAANIYSKSGIFVHIVQVSNHLEIRCGTGQTAGVLTGAPTADGLYDGTMSLAPIGSSQLQYPANWYLHIHSSPDEVYFFVNESGNRWTWTAFGKSVITSIPGSGIWYGATCPHKVDSLSSAGLWLDYGVESSLTWRQSSALFWDGDHSGGPGNSEQPYCFTIDHGLDGNSWSKAGGNDQGSEGFVGWASSPAMVRALPGSYKLLRSQPNTWNQQSILIRIQGYVARASDKHSLVVDVNHARYIRNDNYSDGDIITLGPDKWKVYPFIKRDTVNRNGSISATHSGTIAIAVRYDGP